MGRKLVGMKKQVDFEKFYPLDEAIEVIKQTSYSKFDGSIDLAFKLNLDVRKSEQQLRGVILLPHGTGKTIKVLVATDDPNLAKAAKAAKADIVASKEDLTTIMKENKFDFSVMVADPKMMPFLAKFGKQLGPKGLMPNIKMGTISPDPATAVTKIKKGQANYRTDKAGVIHLPIGKTSFPTDQLVENAQTVINQIKKIKPSVVKGRYIQNLTISATMSPSVKIILVN